jgi:hypothetical protein
MDITNNESPGLFGGLLNFAGTPAGQGLLTAAFSGLAGARRGQPWNNFGRAGVAGLLGYQSAQDQLTQDKRTATAQQLADIQLQQAKQAQQDQQDLRTIAQQFYKAPTMSQADVLSAPGAAGPTLTRAAMLPQTQPTFDTNGFVNAMMAKDPVKGLQLKSSLAKELPFNKIDPKDFTSDSVARFAQTGNYGDLVAARKREFAPNGQVVDLYSAQPGQAYSDPNKPFMTNSQGQTVPNTPFQSFELSKAKAGAPSVTVKNDIKTGESIAGQIGPMVKDSFNAAQGAVQTADAANRVIQAVDSGKVVAGPFANGRLSALQVGALFGIGGKDSAEQIANTRQTIRGLAEMTLQGRKQMTGQGAITESEGKLAERAMSGDISMTPAELKQLANASRRAAQFTYEQHQAQLRNMRARPDLQGMAGFYDTAPFPGSSAPAGFGEIDYGSLK